jgi:signal transduction histidine kinase
MHSSASYPPHADDAADSLTGACERAVCLNNAELATALRHDVERLMLEAASQLRLEGPHSGTHSDQVVRVCEQSARMVHQLSRHLELLSKPLVMAKAVRVAEALRERTDIYRSLLAETTVTSAEDLPEPIVVPEHLDAVLSRLLHNSIVFSGRRPLRIHVAWEHQDDKRVITFSDNGNGVPPSGLRAMFRPFVRLHQAEYTGVGLGLTTCRAICRRYGGDMWADIPVEGGCRINFTFGSAVTRS